MLRVLPALAAVVLVVYAIVDCVQSDPRAVRNLPRLGWLAIIVLIPVLGAMAWLLSGRPQGPKRSAPRPIGPDDDPDFLGGIRPDDR